MPEDVLDQLSKAIGRKVEPKPKAIGLPAQPKTDAQPVTSPSRTQVGPSLESVIGRPVKTSATGLNPLVLNRFNLYSRARQNGFDSKGAVDAAMSHAATIEPGAKPQGLFSKVRSAFDRTDTGKAVESNLSQLSRMLRNTNEKLSNLLGMTDEEWNRAKTAQSDFLAKAVPIALQGNAMTAPLGQSEAASKLATGAAKGAAEFGEEMLSPYQVGLMVGTFGESALARAAAKTGIENAVPIARTLSKLIQLHFTAQMLEGAATGVENTYKAAVNGDWEGAGEAAIEGLSSALMAKGLVSHEQAQTRVRGDLEKTAREMYGVPGQGVKAAISSKFDQLDPYQQGAVIEATVRNSPEYQAVLQTADQQGQQAKDETKKRHEGRLANYYGQALEQSWEPNAARRTIKNLERGRERRAGMVQEEARQQGVRDVVKTIREAAERRSRAINEAYEAERQAGVAERPERRQAAAQARSERSGLTRELADRRQQVFDQRQEARNQPPEVAQRHVEAVQDDEGQVTYPATYFGEENHFGVASDETGHSVFRKTPRGVEWLDAQGNFSQAPESLFNSTDPQTADTIARLTSLTTSADSMAGEEGSTGEQKKDANDLSEIRRSLINGEISAKEAQRQAGIAEKVTLSDEYMAAQSGSLAGPFHETSPADYLSQLESEARTSGMSDEDVDELIKNAGALARQDTERNLDHVYQPGDYITSKRGIRWTLDSKGMLHPSDGGNSVPLMKGGFYSNTAMRLAGSGEIGYGTKTREQRRLDASRQREVESAIRDQQAEVEREMRLATQRQGLETATGEEPRADVEEKQARQNRLMTRPPRAQESAEGKIVRMVLRAPADANSVIRSIAKSKGVTPDEVMRIQLASDPKMSGTTEQKVAGLEVGDRVKEPIRKTPWTVEQAKDGSLALRSGNAQPIRLDRLNPSEIVRGIIERGKIEKDIAPTDIEETAFDRPHYVRWQNEQADEVAKRATGEVKDPEPKTVKQAEVQAQSAERRAAATESVATEAIVDALEPKTDSADKADEDVKAAHEKAKLAEEAYAQQVEAQGKTEPKEDFPQRAPISIGLRGNSGIIRQNQREFKIHHELVPIDAIATSHEWQGSILVPVPKDRYSGELQPRTISESESKLNALRAERGKYDFREYADKTINGSMGPALLEPGGQTVSGNTRLNILRRHIQLLKEISDPEERAAAIAGMHSAMRRLAEENGISRYPSDGTFYVDVRMLDEPIRDTRQAADLGRLFNKPVSTQINKSARGVSYGRSLDHGILEDIARRVEGYDGLVPAMNADPQFFRNIVTDRFGISDEESTDWFKEVDGEGKVLHQEGQNQFVKALLGTIIKDTSVLNRIEGTEPYRALERAFSHVLKMKALPDRDITGKIVEALRAAADTKSTDPNLSLKGDKWAATYRPEQQMSNDLLVMDYVSPPEPDRMVEALWRALHGSDAAVPRVFNDRLKQFIGEETAKAGWLAVAQVETPSEAFNRAFKKELREVQFSRGDKQEGISQEEFDANVKNRELSDQEREESIGEGGRGESKKPEQEGGEVAPTPKTAEEILKDLEKNPRKPTAEEEAILAKHILETGDRLLGKMTPPPEKASATDEAASNLAETKKQKGYVTPEALKTFLETNPTTKEHAPELLRTARLMAEYVFDADPPVGVDRKEALDWVLRERLAGIESGELKTKRGQYSDPNIGLGDGIMKLHQASDPSTFIHEFAHVIFPLLSDEDIKAIDTIRRGDEGQLWDGDRKSLSGDAYRGVSEKLAHGLEKFLRDENPAGFTHEIKKVLAKVKEIMRKVYLSFKGDPLSEYRLSEEGKEVFAKMFGITDFDLRDVWMDEVKKARAEEKRMKKPSEEPHPLVALASKAGAKGLRETIDGKVEDSVGERIDPRKPTAVMAFDDQASALAAWTEIGTEKSKIKDAELVQSPEGEWGIKFNTKTKVPPSALYQDLPERHPGLQLDDLKKRLAGTPTYKTMERQLLQLKIGNLEREIRSRFGAKEEPVAAQPETAAKALEEVKNGRTDRVREESHGVPGIQKPEGTARISKPTIMGMPGHAGTGGKRGGPLRGPVARVPTSLSDVTPVGLLPQASRGEPVGTLKGEAFDQAKWVESLKRAGLPENAPPPTYALDPKTASVLIFPGQKQIVQMAMSALEQGDGFVIASATGTGKTYTAMATVREYREKNPNALILHITKNRGLLNSAQKVAANSFGFHLETDAPEPGVFAGTYGVSYMGLLNDKTYQRTKWDLVIADESGEARNWFKDENQQGKMLIDVIDNAKKAVYLSATPFHSPMEYGYLKKLKLWENGQFDKWIENNFAHEKVKDKIVARLDPAKQAKLRQQLIERGQLVSQAISYEGFTAHFGVVPVTDEMKRGLDRIREGFARARDQLQRMGKKGLAEKAAAFEATYTKAFLERERLPQAIEVARKAREQGWQVMLFSETSAEDLFRRTRDANEEPSTYQQLDDAMGGTLSRIIPPFANIYDNLRSEFGGQIADYSGRGNTMAAREAAKNDFLQGKVPMLYTTYAAGGIGVSLHDADYPELNVKGGDRPRVALFLGPPYSGVLLEQAMGRPWRFGVKSDVHAVFLATDSEPDIRLMQTKVGPRMRALRAAVLGEKDSLASVMASYNDEEKVRARQDALAYSEGDEVKVDSQGFQVRSKSRTVGINDWSQINFPPAADAKNKGMRYGQDVEGGDWSSLFQAQFGMRPPDSPEDAAAKKIIDRLGNEAATGRNPEVQNLDPADRKNAVGLSAATATGEVEVPVDRDKDATARQSMQAGLRNIPAAPYYGLTMSQEIGMDSIARRDGKPQVGANLKRMNRSYRAEYDVGRSQYWNMLEDVLKRYKLKPTDKVIRDISYVMEGKKATTDPAIAQAAADISDMMRIAHGDMAKAGVKVTTKAGAKIDYASFGEDPHYFPHRIDWDYELTDPLTGEKHTLKELMKDKFDEQARQRTLEAIPELKPYSYNQVFAYLNRNDPRAPLLSNVERAREINFPFIKRNYETLIGYFDQVAQATARAKNFGPELERLNNEIRKIKNINGRETLNSMFRSTLEPQNWQDVTAKIYNFAIAYEAASKMTFSAFKVPFHLGLVPLGMEGRVLPVAKAISRLMTHPKEVMENAAYVGTITRQLSAADIMYGEHASPVVRKILKKEMFESAYKIVKAIAGESAKVYLEQYAMNDLKRGGTRAEHTRRLLRDTFLIGDKGIDDAAATGRFTQEDLAKAQTAFANLTTFSDDPLQMPMQARMEIRRTDPEPHIAWKRAVRLTYALQSFSLKATSLLRERLYDEVVVHGNLRPLAYALVASPIVGQMLAATGAAAKHVVHRGLEGLTGQKQHQEDSWDRYLKQVEDTYEHPGAAKLLKFIVDGYTLGYGWDAIRTVADPLMALASGDSEKAGKGFEYMGVDLLEHFVGPFFTDIGKTVAEAGRIGTIAAGKKHPEQKPEKMERSGLRYAADEVPALKEIPQIDQRLKPPPKKAAHTRYY